MEGLPMVSYSRESMNYLIPKLARLKNRTREIPGLPRAHVEGLLESLVSLNGGFVDKVAGRQETDGLVKEWMKQVRQLVVDIEDWVDSKLFKMEEPGNENFGDFLFEEQNFEDFILQISEACERCTRYELLKVPADPPVPIDVVPSNVPVEPRQLLLEEKPAGLVGVDGPIEAILEKLKDRDHESLKVVSIVGLEGLGKTTLAKEIYARLQGVFTCQAFVSVGRRTPVMTTLREILRQVELEPKTDPYSMPVVSEDREAITNLRECLGTNRYFIIIDGVWSTRDWKFINCALPDKNLGSRVLLTTSIMNVAKSSAFPSDVIQMKALSTVNSKELFDANAVSGVDSKEMSDGEADDILKICGGMPLAIIVAAGLLSWKSAELVSPKMLGKSDSTSEAMTKILYMSYADLSVPLKSCFLYLSVFLEDYTIGKDRLIRLWRAEGFIPGNMWKTGQTYFNELICRRLIQPVFGYEDDQAVGCTVHGVILDFIASLSREENFATVGVELKPRPVGRGLPWSLTATAGAELTSGPFPSYETVRRLSLHLSNKGHGNNLVSCNVHLSKVRSLIVFGNIYSSSNPDIEAYKLMRVLDLEGAKARSYRPVGSLFLLRYLGLAGSTVTTKELGEMGKMDHLQTLDIRETGVRELPYGINLMPNLVSLLGTQLTFSPLTGAGYRYEYIRNMEQLSTVDVTSKIDRDVVEDLLLRSKKLRVLGVIANGTSSPHLIISFLDKLQEHKLESLIIESSMDALDKWAPWPMLRRFQSTKSLQRVPQSWVSLHSLTHLDISILHLESRDLFVLGKLPNIILLKLHSEGYEGSGCIVSNGGFQSLEVAWFKCPNGGIGLRFANKAMPKLRKLKLEFNAGKTAKKHGIQFPSNLTQVDVTISCQDSDLMDVEDVERGIKDQISAHPRCPNISVVLIKHKEPYRYIPTEIESFLFEKEMESSSSDFFRRTTPSAFTRFS